MLASSQQQLTWAQQHTSQIHSEQIHQQYSWLFVRFLTTGYIVVTKTTFGWFLFCSFFLLEKVYPRPGIGFNKSYPQITTFIFPHFIGLCYNTITMSECFDKTFFKFFFSFIAILLASLIVTGILSYNSYISGDDLRATHSNSSSVINSVRTNNWYPRPGLG